MHFYIYFITYVTMYFSTKSFYCLNWYTFLNSILFCERITLYLILEIINHSMNLKMTKCIIKNFPPIYYLNKHVSLLKYIKPLEFRE